MGEELAIIKTKLGQLRGKILKSEVFNKPFYSFQGIPYAKPPVGELRFKAPQPFGGWEGVRDALEDGNSTLQSTLFPLPDQDPNSSVEGSEDCLYLNVYCNELPKENGCRKPVMFSIHGGGFSGGSGSLKFSGPDFMLTEDIVFVAINYRCGALGFLSLGTEDVPGNAGMKDQVLALKWVQDNIDSFGGDPNNVTIFGISAGGASVNFHLLSPLSKGLFHKAIVQSGFSTNPWAFQPRPVEKSLELARTLGCKSGNANEVLKFLQSLPAEQIIHATKKMIDSKTFSENKSSIFTPSVEVSGTKRFLPDLPANILKKGEFNKVPVILGSSANEGSVVVFFNGLKQQNFDLLNEKHEFIVPYFLGLEAGSTEEKDAAEAIWKFYLKEKPISWNNVNDYVTYLSDVLFNVGMEKSRLAFLEHSSFPVFSYSFTNHSKRMCFCPMYQSMIEGSENLDKLDTTGACHGADSLYLYSIKLFQSSEKTAAEKEAMLKHIKVWTTFASTGDPCVKDLNVFWKRDSKNYPCYIEIGANWTMKNGIPYPDRIDFWKKLSAKYNQEF